MADTKIFMTAEGLAKLKKELSDLENIKRPSVVERLALARMQGDLSENNEYAAAREELAILEGRIDELKDVLERVSVITQKANNGDSVGLGCKVTVKANNTESIYHIVGEWEADPSQKKVSHSSPLGKALLGRKVGEDVEFEAPAGKILFKILKID